MLSERGGGSGASWKGHVPTWVEHEGVRPGHEWEGPVKHTARSVKVDARVLLLRVGLLRVGLNEGECSGVQPVCAVVETFIMMPMFDLED